MPPREYDFFCVLYIAASRSHQFYVGFTNSLQRRMKEHKELRAGTYTARYNIDRLVYYEHFQYVLNAIAREKEVKDWSRAKKIALIESLNPTWRDLSEDWGKPAFATADSSASLRNDKQKTFRRKKESQNDRVSLFHPRLRLRASRRQYRCG